MATYALKRGDTWNPTLLLYANKAKTQAFDASDYSAKCYIKEGLDAELPTVLELDAIWTNQAGGEGAFAMTHAESVKLRIHEYTYEVKLYDDSSSGVAEFQKTISQGILDVVEVLKTTGLT